MHNTIIMNLRAELERNSDSVTAAGGQRFFKEEIKCHGVKTFMVGKMSRSFFAELADMSKEEIFSLCEELFQSDYNEEVWIASDWAYRLRAQYQPTDFEVFERWMAAYINNWAKCDTLCNHSIGELIEQYPEYVGRLKEWTSSGNRWLRRGAAVSLIIPARRGKFLPDIFEIARRLLKDGDDLVQKGYGWMLKAASQAHQQEVFNFVMENKREMPRTALRYAIEKMPSELRAEGMRL